MRKILLSVLVAGAALLALPMAEAHAATVNATIRDGYVTPGYGYLRGSWNANFAANVGANTATLNGSFNVKRGSWANWFGGRGAAAPLSANLWNFRSSVTGAKGVVTQTQFGGDIFAEAMSYGPQGSTPTRYISFNFDEIFIQGVNGAYLAAGRGSTFPNFGRIWNNNGNLVVNFWMNRERFNSPSGNQYTFSTGSWLTVVLSHGVSGAPVPEPSTWAMLGLTALGTGCWIRSRRRRQTAAV